MKMVVLDGYCKNPGDISWEPLTSLCETTIYDRTEPEQLLERIAGADIVLSNKVVITAEDMDKCPDLKCICIPATGYDHIDCAAASERGITVCNVPEYGAFSVAQHVFAMLLDITNRVSLHDASVRAGDWCNCPDFCYWKAPLHELCGKTMSIFGYSCKGDNMAAMAKAFGMKVMVDGEPSVDSELMFVDRLTAIRNADVIVLNCDLNEDTRGMICADTIAEMKAGVIIINVSRGALIVDEDLIAGLKSGKIGYAALDAVAREPMQPDDILLQAPNCIINPHIAGCTVECRQKLMDITTENIRRFLAGNPQNLVITPTPIK